MPSLLATVQALDAIYAGLVGPLEGYGPSASEVRLADRASARDSSAAVGSAGHETRIGTDDGALEENPMCRVRIFRDRTKYRVRVIDRESGRMTSSIYETEEEALAAVRKIKREYNRPVGIEFSKAIDAYELFMRAKGNRPRSIDVTVERLSRFFAGVTHTDDLAPVVAAKLWAKFTMTPTRTGRVPAFDTQANTLQQVRTFVRWIVERGWTKVSDPVAGLKAIGRRNKGKRQLAGLDESRRFLATSLELGKAGDGGAVAAAMALLMGMRASEIVERTVRELDDGGRILLITRAKTRAGVRRLMIPEVLQPLLLKVAEGRGPDDRLFPYDRHWVLRAVARLCRAAGVPVVPAHGLRGTHSTLAIDAGLSGPAVAAALGHSSFTVTANHYAAPGSVESARTGRVIDALN